MVSTCFTIIGLSLAAKRKDIYKKKKSKVNEMPDNSHFPLSEKRKTGRLWTNKL